MINGGIKFFELNLADLDTFAKATASSGNVSADNIIDKNDYTYWRSVGSDDSTIEYIYVTFIVAKTFSRLFIIDHNLKEFDAKYWDGAAYQDFSNVIGVNGITSSDIDENAFSLDTAYYEFDEVSSSIVRISCLKSQVVDAEKYINKVFIGSELGTLEGFPTISKIVKNKNIRKNKVLNEKFFVDKSLETKNFEVKFKNYPPTLSNDLDLIVDLFERDDSFLVWLCGGRSGTPYFKYNLPGIRLKDLIQMQVTNPYNDKYRKNYYNGVVDMRTNFEEAT